MTVKVEDAFNNVVTTDSSAVTLTLSSGTFEGGSSMATAAAASGVATFSGLKITVPGSYTLSATDGTLTSPGASNSFTMTPPPTVVGKVLFTQKTNKRGKPVGKATFAGFEFDFSTAMDPATTANKVDYSLGTYVTVNQKVGKRTVKVLQLKPLGFTLSSYNPANNSVRLVPVGKQTFAKGG